jgi:ribosomal protein S18 acetylase RimI-like enzyme
MAEDFWVKVAASEDIDAIMRLLQLQFEEHQIDVEGPDLRAGAAEILRDKRLGVILTARQGEAIIGIAVLALAWTLEHGGRSAWLDELYVHPHFQGQGIGQALIEAATVEAIELKCSAIDLEVDEDHSRAERLYKRQGFERLSRSRWVKRLDKSPG